MTILNQAIYDQFNESLTLHFDKGLKKVVDETPIVATITSSSTQANIYHLLSEVPHMALWPVGADLSFGDISTFDPYTVPNNRYGRGLKVPVDAIEDDSIGQYAGLAESYGRESIKIRNHLVFEKLKNGGKELCYDGQFYFDADHPVYTNPDGTGGSTPTSNVIDDGNKGTEWYLVSEDAVYNPIILQERLKPALIKATPDSALLTTDELMWRMKARFGVGFGLWQTCVRSNKPLTESSFLEAYNKMTGFKEHGGRPLGIMPTTLLVPVSLMTPAKNIVEASTKDGGADNTLKGQVKLQVSRWL